MHECFKRAGEVNKGNSEKIDEVDQESNKGGEQTENQTAGAYSKQATPRWLKEFLWLQYKEQFCYVSTMDSGKYDSFIFRK